MERLVRRIGLADGAGATSLTLSPDHGPPGSTVTLTATGLPKDEWLLVGGGTINTAFQVLQSARTLGKGTLDVEVKVPERQGDTRLVFVLRDGDAVKLNTKPFRIAP